MTTLIEGALRRKLLRKLLRVGILLALISVNLAVVNFLPIPVLDGGHMVFLIYEWLRGKPASQAIYAFANYAGLFLIASLMLFVIYLDISRHL